MDGCSIEGGSMNQEKKRHQSASVSALPIWRANAYFPGDYSARSACIRPNPRGSPPGDHTGQSSHQKQGKDNCDVYSKLERPRVI